jgi:hypothetical protein
LIPWIEFLGFFPGGFNDLADSFFIEGVSTPKTLMIIADKDNLRENHTFGPTIVVSGGIQGVQYWDQFNATPALANLTPATGKEILVTFTISKISGTNGNVNFKVWAGPTFGSKTSARDVFGFELLSAVIDLAMPSFILKAGEFMAIENNHTTRQIRIERLVAVERDAT